MKSWNPINFIYAGLYAFVAFVLFASSAHAGAPVIPSPGTVTLTPIPSGSTTHKGDSIATILSPIVSDGTLFDNFEDNNTTSQWGGSWFTFTDAPGGLSTITPFTQPAAPGYNSAYCAKINIALHVGTLTYNPFVGIGVDLKSDKTACDLTKATGFRYWYKGGAHIFKVETSDIVTSVATYYSVAVPSSPVWKQAVFTWDSLKSTTFSTGVVTVIPAASKLLAQKFSWVIQGADGLVDSLFIDNVEATGFSDRGMAVTGCDTANGKWQYTKDNGATWPVISAPSDAAALLLAASSRIRFMPALSSFAGSSSIRFRAWNQTDGKTAGSIVSVVPSGGVSAYSSATDTGAVQVGTAPHITSITPATTTTVYEGGNLSLTVLATGNPAPQYTWMKNGAALVGNGANTGTYSKIATLSDSGTYSVSAQNTMGTVQSAAVKILVVSQPVKAAFSTSALVGKIPFAVQFRDSSTGIFAKRNWAFGDGGTDTSKNPSHTYSTEGVFTVSLRLTDNTGKLLDSAVTVVKAYKTNPVVMHGTYATQTSASLTLGNFSVLPGGTSSPFADSIALFAKAHAIPTTATGLVAVKTYSLAFLKTKGDTFTDVVSLPGPLSDSVYGFVASVHWNDGWSTFTSVNGCLVYMRDTATPANNLVLSGAYFPKDTVHLILDNISSLDTLKTDTLLVWYSLIDSVANFNDKNVVRGFATKDIVRGAVKNQYVLPIQNTAFNTEQKTVYFSVVVLGKNDRQSPIKKCKFPLGTVRPQNPIRLLAKALTSNQIRLTGADNYMVPHLKTGRYRL